MKKQLATTLSAILISTSLAMPLTANADTLTDAYSAYYGLILELEADIGSVTSELAPIRDGNGYHSYYSSGINAAYLVDFDKSGIPELVLSETYTAGNVASALREKNLLRVLTYYGGSLNTLYSGEQTAESVHISTDTHGISYLTETLLTSFSTVEDYVSLYGGKWQTVYTLVENTAPVSYSIETLGIPARSEQSAFYSFRNDLRGGGYVSLSHTADASIETVLGELEGHLGSEYIESLTLPSPWARDTVNEAIEDGFVPESLTASYTAPIKRGEFCALAVSFYEQLTGSEIDGRASFNDTSDENVEKMGYLGIVNGVGGGAFEPERLISREEAATILTRLADSIGIPLEKDSTLTYGDASSISSWARVSVSRLKESLVMLGVGDDLFEPSKPYTREQSIVTVKRLGDLAVFPTAVIAYTDNTDKLKVGAELGLISGVLPENAVRTALEWTSSNPKIATVDENGIVNGIRAGIVDITARGAGGLEYDVSLEILPSDYIELTHSLPKTVSTVLYESEYRSSTRKTTLGSVGATVIIAECRNGKTVNASGYLNGVFSYEAYRDRYLSVAIPWELRTHDGRTIDKGNATAEVTVLSDGSAEFNFTFNISPDKNEYRYTLEIVDYNN